VILGSNRDEFKTFRADKPEHSRLLLGKVPILRDRSAYQVEMKYMSNAWKALHIDTPADAMLAGGHADVWTYRFDWDEAPAIPFIRPDLLLGAAHGMVNTPFNRSGRSVLAQAMGDAWTRFARDGLPTLPGHEWPRRSLNAEQSDCLVFDTERDGGIRMMRIRTDMAAVKQALKTDAAAEPATLRCRIHARLFVWNPLFAGHGDASEYESWCREFGCTIPAIEFRPRVEV
jgi:para-nitrobenzyl esterase